jgi:hypothetical protein
MKQTVTQIRIQNLKDTLNRLEQQLDKPWIFSHGQVKSEIERVRSALSKYDSSTTLTGSL